jgi:hypothetical protein
VNLRERLVAARAAEVTRYDACPSNEIQFHNGVVVGLNWALALLLDASAADEAKDTA